METDEPAEWTVDEHLAHGRAAVGEISLLAANSIADPHVCFHLSPASADDDDKWGMEAAYCIRARDAFASCPDEFDVDYVAGAFGVEAWQSVLPSMAWLERTFPIVSDVAKKSGLLFVGWSFEPRGGPFISVSPTLNVFDGKKLSGLPMGADALSFEGLRQWLKRRLG